MRVFSRGRLAPRTFFIPLAITLGMVMLVAAAALFGRTAANAASATVTVGSPTNQFSSNVSNINVGDKVTFTWAAGNHVVDLKDVSPDIPMDSTHTSGATTAFTAPGTYYYYCSVHASEALATEAHVQANDAMVGKIVVTGTAAPAAPSTGTGIANTGRGGDQMAAIALLAGACLVFIGTATFAGTRK